MILGYLIYSEYESKRNAFFIEKLINASNKYSIKLILLLSEKINFVLDSNRKTIYYENKLLDMPDFVIQRTMNHDLSFKFEKLGIRVFNSSYISLVADNKYNAYMEVSKLGVNILNTRHISDKNSKNIFFPNVTKPIDSKGGDRVFFNKNIEEYKESIKKYKNDFLLQEPSEVLGKDLRVYVIGKKIIISMLRTSNSGFISNYTKGGNASPYKLNSYEESLVNKIIDVFDFDYVGIDFLFNKDGLVFNEIENVVGARMLYELTNIDIAEFFIEYIKSKF